MPRALVVIDVSQGERAAFASWLAAWRPRLTSVSDNTGCGCCVDIYEVEGPAEAIAAIPEQMVGFDPAGRPGDLA